MDNFHTLADDPLAIKIDRETYFALAKMPFDMSNGFNN